MKGVVYLGESRVEVRDFPDPTPGPEDVLVKIEAGGLCGSDLHKYHKSREWAEERDGMIAGHEPAGVVAALGHGVTNVAVGDRVSVYHSLGCGQCPTCLSGTPVFCRNEGAFGRTRDGCHADLMTAPARYCLPLPPAFSFATGTALACTACTAYSALSKLPLRHGQTLAVFGLGPVGLSGMLLGRAMGFRCIGVDVSSYRVALATDLAAGDIIDAGKADPVEAIMDLTAGQGAEGVLECSGNAKARSQTALAAARHGSVVIVGAGDADMNLDPQAMIFKELTIRGNSVFPVSTYFEAVAFLETHDVPLDDMVTHRFKITQAEEAYAVFDSARTGKVIFESE